MSKVKKCEECGIPLAIASELKWGNNGVITMAKYSHVRMVFYESRTIDNLFAGIEELIGMPIEHIVIESRRREARKFMEKSVPPVLRNMLKFVDYRISSESRLGRSIRRLVFKLGKTMTVKLINVWKMYGYGEVEMGEGWDTGAKHPWRSNVIHNPYSLPFVLAELLGSAEASDGIDEQLEYEKIGENSYLATAYPAEHLVAFEERLKRKRYDFKPGNTVFDRCSSCGLPKELGAYIWDVEKGTITDSGSGWRMAIYSPAALQAVLDDLEAELGESVPKAVIEAQRRYVKSRVAERDWRKGGGTFNHLTALRGLGNITRFEADKDHLDLTIENACLPLVMVGMSRAIYEIALDADKTSFEWDFNEDGDLNISIRAG